MLLSSCSSENKTNEIGSFSSSSPSKTTTSQPVSKTDQTEPMDFSSSPTFASSQNSSLRSNCENPSDITDCLSKFRAVSEGNKL